MATKIFTSALAQGGGGLSFSVDLPPNAVIGQSVLATQNYPIDFTVDPPSANVGGEYSIVSNIQPSSFNVVIPSGLPEGITPINISAGGSTFNSSINLQSLPVLNFVSSGDANGLIYYLGTDGGQQSFVNPYPSKINLLASGTFNSSFPVQAATDRANSQFASLNSSNSWWVMTLLEGSLAPNHLVIRRRYDATTGLPRNFKLQGTNSNISNAQSVNTASWADLLTVTNDPVLSNNIYADWTITGNQSFSSFRILNFGPDSEGNFLLTLGEIEFYGSLFP